MGVCGLGLEAQPAGVGRAPAWGVLLDLGRPLPGAAGLGILAEFAKVLSPISSRADLPVGLRGGPG